MIVFLTWVSTAGKRPQDYGHSHEGKQLGLAYSSQGLEMMASRQHVSGELTVLHLDPQAAERDYEL